MNPNVNKSTSIEPSSLFGGVSADQIMAMTIMESCAAKTVLSGGAGFVLGGVNPSPYYLIIILYLIFLMSGFWYFHVFSRLEREYG